MSQITTPDSPKSEAHTPAPSQPFEPQNGNDQSGAVYYTPHQEARVVRKLDINLMTLFFFLCEYNTVPAFTGPTPAPPATGELTVISVKTCWRSLIGPTSVMPRLQACRKSSASIVICINGCSTSSTLPTSLLSLESYYGSCSRLT